MAKKERLRCFFFCDLRTLKKSSALNLVSYVESIVMGFSFDTLKVSREAKEWFPYPSEFWGPLTGIYKKVNV